MVFILYFNFFEDLIGLIERFMNGAASHLATTGALPLLVFEWEFIITFMA